MRYAAIKETDRVSPGEYLLYEPTQEIVLCGSVSYDNGTIKALGAQGMISDTFDNYKKINMTKRERAESQQARCKGCGG